MIKSGVRFYFFICGLLLASTAVAKIISALDRVPALKSVDPVLGIRYGSLFFSAGAVELIVAALCFLPVRLGVKAGLVAWLGTGFVFYHAAAFVLGYHGPCGCLGSLTGRLGISQAVAGRILNVIIFYLCAGSYGVLWMLKRKRSLALSSSRPTA